MAGWVRKPSDDGTMRWFRESVAADASSPVGMLVKSENTTGSAPTMATLLPPPSSLDLKEQAAHSNAFKDLHEQVKRKGLYQTRYLAGYGPEVVRYVLLGLLSAYLYRHGWLFFSAVALGGLWHQLVFTVHDLGHMGVTHDWEWDRLVAIFLADFIGGLSVGWWVDVSICFESWGP